MGNIGPDAIQAAPQLEKILASGGPPSVAAAAALCKIDPMRHGLGLLNEALQDTQLRPAAIDELGNLGPAAAPALDALIAALRTEAGRDRVGSPGWIMISRAIYKISPTNRAVIRVLLEKLREAKEAERQITATAPAALNPSGYFVASAKNDCLTTAAELVQFDPAEPHGLAVLIEILRFDPEPVNRDFAAYVLRQAGPGARVAIPALKAALQDKDRKVRRAAASALRKMETAKAH